jgi:hypothetical protein
VFESRVLRRIFGSKRDEVTGGWRKLHSDKPHKLYSSPHIVRMIKSRLAEHAAGMRKMRNVCRMLSEDLNRGGHFGVLGMGGKRT